MGLYVFGIFWDDAANLEMGVSENGGVTPSYLHFKREDHDSLVGLEYCSLWTKLYNRECLVNSIIFEMIETPLGDDWGTPEATPQVLFRVNYC